jgi:hypothetical protein
MRCAGHEADFVTADSAAVEFLEAAIRWTLPTSA